MAHSVLINAQGARIKPELIRGDSPQYIGWLEFQTRYENEYLAKRKKSYRKKWDSTVTRIVELLAPGFVDELTSQKLSQFYGLMKAHRFGKQNDKRYAEATIESHFRTILAALSWDWTDPFALDIDCKYPRYVIDGDSQKSGKTQILPIAPEYAMMLLEVPERERTGRVLNWPYS